MEALLLGIVLLLIGVCLDRGILYLGRDKYLQATLYGAALILLTLMLLYGLA